MHLDLSAADTAFLAEVRRFIDEYWPPTVRQPRPLSDAHASPPDAAAQAWFAALVERGWSVPHWPAEHGGTGWPAVRRHLWARETALAETPPLDPCGVHLVGPLVCALGTAAQQRQWLPPIRQAQVRCCLGWAEPDAGSDLNGVATRAEPEAGGYRLHGVKSWVAGAPHATWMLCLARTGAGRDDLALFLFAMDLPGVRVQPRTTLDGAAALATVALEGVRVPAAALLGPPTGALGTLARLERFIPAVPLLAPRLGVHLARLRRRLQEAGDDAADDLAGLRRRVAELEVEVAGLEGLELRALVAEDRGDTAALASLLRLRQAAAAQRLGELQVESLGYYGLPYPDALLIDNEGPIGHHYALSELADMLRGRAWSIDGGTSEIHKNRIARTILGF